MAVGPFWMPWLDIGAPASPTAAPAPQPAMGRMEFASSPLAQAAMRGPMLPQQQAAPTQQAPAPQPQQQMSFPQPQQPEQQQQPGFFDRLAVNPLFLAGLTGFGGYGPGTGAQIAQGNQRGQMEQQEWQQQQEQRRRMQEAWGRIFPNGQPAAGHPMLRGAPPELMTLAQAMGPEQGLPLLAKYAMSANKTLTPLEQAQLAKVQAETRKLEGEVLKQRTPEQAGNNISQGLTRLSTVPQEYGGSFTSAVGPIRGDDQSWMAPLARVWGSITSSVPFVGGDASPTEVRTRIKADSEALAAAIKPLIRAPGEGAWTDQDQARLVAVVGDLTTARDAAEYQRRLEDVRQRVRSNFNIEVPPIGAGAPSGTSAGGEVRKTINGRNYVKRGSDWYEE